ncbi:hypothetical protein M8J76_006417 [Diaphorina citri]|nr:hypothetical protein M8J76_006417 [Diaphorina citri]
MLEHCVVEATRADRDHVLTPGEAVEKAWLMSRPTPLNKFGRKLTVSTRCQQIVRDCLRSSAEISHCLCHTMREFKPILYKECETFEAPPVYHPNATLDDFNWTKRPSPLKRNFCC